MGSKDGSVAPKERINIKMSSGAEGVESGSELPLKLMVAGDYTGKADDTPVEDRKVISVDKNNFDDVMGAHNLSLDMNVADKLSDSDDPDAGMSVHLDIQNMKDFTPDEIAKQVPELAQLLKLREALKAVKGPLGNVPEFRKKLAAIVEDENARKALLDELDLKNDDKDKE